MTCCIPFLVTVTNTGMSDISQDILVTAGISFMQNVGRIWFMPVETVMEMVVYSGDSPIAARDSKEEGGMPLVSIFTPETV